LTDRNGKKARLKKRKKENFRLIWKGGKRMRERRKGCYGVADININKGGGKVTKTLGMEEKEGRKAGGGSPKRPKGEKSCLRDPQCIVEARKPRSRQARKKGEDTPGGK